MVKAIVSDLDGVIRTFPLERDRNIETRFQLKEGAIAAVAFEKSLLHNAVTGQISDEEWRQQILNQLQGIYPNVDCSFVVRSWSDFPGDFNNPVFNFIKAMSSQMPFCLLTNATDRLAKDLKILG